MLDVGQKCNPPQYTYIYIYIYIRLCEAQLENGKQMKIELARLLVVEWAHECVHQMYFISQILVHYYFYLIIKSFTSQFFISGFMLSPGNSRSLLTCIAEATEFGRPKYSRRTFVFGS